jgi:hypothetical protein
LEAGFTIYAIIVRILRDAWVVAPGLVSERGDRVCGDRIPQRLSSRALRARWIERGVDQLRVASVDTVTIFSSRTYFAERRKEAAPARGAPGPGGA